MRFLWNVIFLGGALLAAGCTGTYYTDRIPPAADGTSAFSQGLRSGYSELTLAEGDEQDFCDAALFADKGAAAAGGAAVEPEMLADWDLPEGSINDLAAARNRLTAALAQSARDKAPGAASRAQVMFDCWVQEQEEDNQPEHIAACRSAFEAAMAEVDAAMAPPVAAPAPPPTADIRRQFLVFFDWDSDTITAEAAGVIAEAAATARANDVTLVLASGHTDTSGAASYNMGLSIRRAEAVRAALVSQGMFESDISVIGLGEEDPLVATADGVREPQNRRVSIELKE